MRLNQVNKAVAPLKFTVDGKTCEAYPGDTISVALYAVGQRAWRQSRQDEARGLLCGMGICFDCLVTVDGKQNLRACQTLIKEGMQVETTAKVSGKE